MSDISSAVITGPTGVVGTSLISELVESGVEVYAVCRPGTARADRVPRHPLVHTVWCSLQEVSRLPELARNRPLVGLYLATILFATGYYTGYSYIEPFLQQVAQMPDALITAALTVFGVAGLAGSWLFARLFDGHRRTFLSATMVGVSAALFMLLPLAGWVAGPLATCVVWGVSATAFNVAAQAEVIRVTSEETSAVAMSIFSGLFNVGIGTGSIVGGIVCDGPGMGLVGVVGGIIAAVGALYCVARLGGLLERPGRAA